MATASFTNFNSLVYNNKKYLYAEKRLICRSSGLQKTLLLKEIRYFLLIHLTVPKIIDKFAIIIQVLIKNTLLA